MRTKLLILTTAIGVIGAATTGPRTKADIASAGPANYAQGPGPYDFDCDSPAGEPKQLNIRAPSAKLQVTGSLRFVTTRQKYMYMAVAAIGIVQPGREQDIGLVAWVENDRTTRFAFGRSSDVVSIPSLRAISNEEAFTTNPIPFVVTINNSGKASASIDNFVVARSRTVPGLERVRLSCSTAHVKFSNVTVEALP